jgi:hypothetical protein
MKRLPIANELDPVQGEIPMALRDKLAELGLPASSFRRNTAARTGIFEYVLVTELARMSVASIIARERAWRRVQRRASTTMLPKMAKGECPGPLRCRSPTLV